MTPSTNGDSQGHLHSSLHVALRAFYGGCGHCKGVAYMFPIMFLMSGVIVGESVIASRGENEDRRNVIQSVKRAVNQS